MASIRLERVAFAYPSSPPLLADVDLHLTRGFTGLVGDNGAGKSTLLALIAGELAPTAGHVRHDPPAPVIARCPQELDELPADATALAERDDADAGRWRALLALDVDELARWTTLSPGERRRWQLGGALAREPDVLLLDEPTNHVDATCRALLVGALGRYGGIALVVSHDRALLDALTSATVRVHGGGARRYPGGYTAAKASWDAERARALELRRDAVDAAQRATKQLVRARDDQRAVNVQRSASARMKGPKDHDATTIMRTNQISRAEALIGRRVEVLRRAADAALAAIPEVEHARELGRSVFVGYERCPRRFVLELDAPVIYPGNADIARATPLLTGVRVAVRPGDRVHIAGDNGAGKSTLLAALLAACTLPRDRMLVLPQELAREQGPVLLEATRQLARDVRGRVLSLVAALGVDPDRLLASASPSPGELRKLALALGLGQQAWLVVLDEPTNHLDLPSIERLEAALAGYPGALVLVSHDTQFASELTTTRWHVAGGHVEV